MLLSTLPTMQLTHGLTSLEEIDQITCSFLRSHKRLYTGVFSPTYACSTSQDLFTHFHHQGWLSWFFHVHQVLVWHEVHLTSCIIRKWAKANGRVFPKEHHFIRHRNVSMHDNIYITNHFYKTQNLYMNDLYCLNFWKQNGDETG